MCVDSYIYVHVCTYMYVHICIHKMEGTWVHVSRHPSWVFHIYVCIHTCIKVYMYAYVCIYNTLHRTSSMKVAMKCMYV